VERRPEPVARFLSRERHNRQTSEHLFVYRWMSSDVARLRCGR
jgi:hypothetical protein